MKPEVDLGCRTIDLVFCKGWLFQNRERQERSEEWGWGEEGGREAEADNKGRRTEDHRQAGIWLQGVSGNLVSMCRRKHGCASVFVVYDQEWDSWLVWSF